MTEKRRIVHMEVADDTWVDCDGLNRGLNRLAQLAEESNELEKILEHAMKALYIAQPNGKKNYQDGESKIGSIYISRFNQDSGKMNVTYSTNRRYRPTWNHGGKGLTVIDLGAKTYSTTWGNNYNEDFWQIPKILMKDTERVMKCLGLKKEEKK